MKRSLRKRLARRSFLKAAGLFSIGSLWTDSVLEALPQNTNTNSRPELGVTLNEEAVKTHLMPGTGYFEPTPQWDNEGKHVNDRLWS